MTGIVAVRQLLTSHYDSLSFCSFPCIILHSLLRDDDSLFISDSLIMKYHWSDCEAIRRPVLRSILKKRTSGHSTVRASCCLPSCPRWHRKKAAAFPRTALGARESDLQTERSVFRSSASLATTVARMGIWWSTGSRQSSSNASTACSYRV